MRENRKRAIDLARNRASDFDGAGLHGGEGLWIGERVLFVLDPQILVGKPVIRGTRMAVEFIIDLLAQGWSEDEVVLNYPGITHDDILACLCYAREVLNVEETQTRSVAIRKPGLRRVAGRVGEA